MVDVVVAVVIDAAATAVMARRRDAAGAVSFRAECKSARSTPSRPLNLGGPFNSDLLSVRPADAPEPASPESKLGHVAAVKPPYPSEDREARRSRPSSTLRFHRARRRRAGRWAFSKAGDRA